MAPFRWPSVSNDILLCKEALARRLSSPCEWEMIAETLSGIFSTAEKKVDLKGRGCRERIDRLIQKFEQDDKKALKKSGTEEEYSELKQLLEDISIYRRDMEELKNEKFKGRERKKEIEKQKKEKGIEMRAAALSRMSKEKHQGDFHESDSENDDDDDEEEDELAPIPAKKTCRPKKRTSRISVMNMLEQKYDRKASLKEQELKQRMLEFEFEKHKYEVEAAERKERLDLELEEKRVMLNLLKEKLL